MIVTLTRLEIFSVSAQGIALLSGNPLSSGEEDVKINYRVDDLQALLAKLTAADVEILEGPQYHENGVFAWIVDPDGNKVELWEPKTWDEKNKC